MLLVLWMLNLLSPVRCLSRDDKNQPHIKVHLLSYPFLFCISKTGLELFGISAKKASFTASDYTTNQQSLAVGQIQPIEPEFLV